jgi:hypothetical protein
MAYNFRRGDRGQLLLLPRPARLAARRPSGLVRARCGRPARPRPVPARLPRRRARPSRVRPQAAAGRAAVRLRLGVRSSRQIQRRCTEDLAFRVLSKSRGGPRRPAADRGVCPVSWADDGSAMTVVVHWDPLVCGPDVAQCGLAGHELGKHCRHACHPEATQGRAVVERLRFSVGGPLPGTAGGGRTRLRPCGRHFSASWTAACASAVGGPDLAKPTIGGNLGCRP